MKEAGIELYFFNPIRPILAIYMNNRDPPQDCRHRRQDGPLSVGSTSPTNTSIKSPRFGHWKDTAIKIEGNAVFSLTVMFLHFYRHLSKKADRLHGLLRRKPQSMKTKASFRCFSDSPTDEELVAENAHLSLSTWLKKNLYIMTPYLVIGHEMITALVLAAQSGVDVPDLGSPYSRQVVCPAGPHVPIMKC